MDAINPSNNSPTLKYQKIKGERFLLYYDCPITDFRVSHYKSASFRVSCDTKKICQLVLLFDRIPKAQNFTVTIANGKIQTVIPLLQADERQLKYAVPTDSNVTIRWK